MRAYLKNYRQSPRKVRLVTMLVRGKSVTRALAELSVLPKRATTVVRKLIESAAANASADKKSRETLFIKDIRVDGGAVLKRHRGGARGRAHPLAKRTSHIVVELVSKIAAVPRQKTKTAQKVTAKAK